MKTQIKLKDGHTIPQPMTNYDWKFGYIDGYCRTSDDRCHAIVVTEHDEFEYVHIQSLVKFDWMLND
jgi:hypothetical protein